MKITTTSNARVIPDPPPFTTDERPGLRPGDPYRVDPGKVHREVWGVVEPRGKLTILQWWTSKEMVEEWKHDRGRCIHGVFNQDCRGCANEPPHFPMGIDEYLDLRSAVRDLDKP